MSLQGLPDMGTRLTAQTPVGAQPSVPDAKLGRATHWIRRGAWVVLAAPLVGPWASLAGAQSTPVRIFELVSPTGGPEGTRGFGINDNGDVVGQLVVMVETFERDQAGLWLFTSRFGFAEGVHNLSIVAELDEFFGRANDINIDGIVVGSQEKEIEAETRFWPFVWRLDPEEYLSLGAFCIDETCGVGGSAESINDLDPATIVGTAGYPEMCFQRGVVRGFAWEDGGDPDELTMMVPLDVEFGDEQSTVYGIPKSLVDPIVGDSERCGAIQQCGPAVNASAWSLAGVPAALTELPSDNFIQGRGVNDSETIVGVGRIEGDIPSECLRHALVWESLTADPFDLHEDAVPAIPSLRESLAEAINNEDECGLRQVVGHDLTQNVAMRWDSIAPTSWTSVDLNDLVHARQAARWVLRSANDINFAGLVVGEGLFDAQIVNEPPRERGFLLTCGTDLNGDGQIDGGDLGIVLQDWDCTEPASDSLTCPGDVDFSGFVDGDDLGQVLAAWGACSLRPECIPESLGELQNESISQSAMAGPGEILLILGELGFTSIAQFAAWADSASPEARAAAIASIQMLAGSL